MNKSTGMPDKRGKRRRPRNGGTRRQSSAVHLSGNSPSNTESAKSGQGEKKEKDSGLPARRAAAAILHKIIAEAMPLDPLFDPKTGHAGLRALEPRDRRLVRAIVGVALRRRGTIENRIAACLNGPLKDKTGRIATILHVAAAQILFLDIPDHAVVNLAVASTRGHVKTRHAAGLVNGVLRRLSREAKDDTSASAGTDDPMADTPDWLARRWTATYGAEQAAAIATAHRDQPPLDLTARSDPDAVAAETGGTRLPTDSIRLAAGGDIAELPGYQTGSWWVQDAAAAIPARLLGNVQGKSIADLCAAPGGKTAQLAAAGARVTAVEAVESRAARLSQNLARLNLQATIVTADIMTWEPDEPFDAILLDAPCSATGTIRRHPDIAWLKTEADVTAMAKIQNAMLARTATWLKPGGLLVYCTCSLETEESEDQIAAFLAGHDDFGRDPVAPGELAGLDGLINAAGDFRTLPHYSFGSAAIQIGMDGFFAARLRRT
ncbi:MAG: RsmB/NOP family class I SAM-dependent RNA methyltransferase [Alphaproteobacteria bacterium]